MTGEMSQFDADHGEEWALHRSIARAIGGKIRAFDVYQGPYIQPQEGGRLWLSSDDGGSVTPVWEKGGSMIEGEPCLWDDEEGIIAMSRDVLGGVYGDDSDPTPYETGEPDNLPREAQERAVEEMRMKR